MGLLLSTCPDDGKMDPATPVGQWASRAWKQDAKRTPALAEMVQWPLRPLSQDFSSLGPADLHETYSDPRTTSDPT